MSGVEKPTVLVTHWVHPEVERDLARFCTPEVPRARDVMPRSQVLGRLERAAGVIVCMADHVDEEFLAAGRRLRVVSATLKGHENIDVAACTRRGIWLSA